MTRSPLPEPSVGLEQPNATVPPPATPLRLCSTESGRPATRDRNLVGVVARAAVAGLLIVPIGAAAAAATIIAGIWAVVAPGRRR